MNTATGRTAMVFLEELGRERRTEVPGETDEVIATRVLAHACDQLGEIIDDYRRRVLVRLTEQRRAWPF